MILENCTNWYRSPVDGAVTGLWPGLYYTVNSLHKMLILAPGTCLHLVRTLAHPRWEDYKYTPRPEDRTYNRFYWLGDGLTYA